MSTKRTKKLASKKIKYIIQILLVIFIKFPSITSIAIFLKDFSFHHTMKKIFPRRTACTMSNILPDRIVTFSMTSILQVRKKITK